MKLSEPAWYAMRVTYGRELIVKTYFDAVSIESFVPMHYESKIKKGTRCRVLIPVIHNLIFIRTSKPVLDNIKATMSAKLPIRYIMKTDNGQRKPIIVPDDQMRHFIAVTGNYDEQVIYLNPEEAQFNRGDKVRITGGPFAGVEGQFLRIGGSRSRRVVVAIAGVMAVATATIHPSLVEKIE